MSESCQAHFSTSNPARLIFPYNGTLFFPDALETKEYEDFFANTPLIG
jgi:hypothetical protein